MARFSAAFVALVMLAVPTFAQESRPPSAGRPAVFVAPSGDGFEVYLAAALLKKGVPVAIVEKEEAATYVLKTTHVETHQVSTGAKWANCLFAYCAGNADKASTSAQLVKDGAIVWSYSVNKGRGEKNRQSMAESIAKNLKKFSFARVEAQ
jgi:hypothetical protein